eukprot:scaffold327284_cov22-Prasinocladus_malaysianus.AAC.1
MCLAARPGPGRAQAQAVWGEHWLAGAGEALPLALWVPGQHWPRPARRAWRELPASCCLLGQCLRCPGALRAP